MSFDLEKILESKRAFAALDNQDLLWTNQPRMGLRS